MGVCLLRFGIDLKTFKLILDVRPTYDASSLVHGRNAHPIAVRLMEKEEAKRAGLRVEETLALRMYTGKIPVGWRSLSTLFYGEVECKEKTVREKPPAFPAGVADFNLVGTPGS